MRNAQERIVANIECKRWDSLTVRALGAFESGQNSGMLVKKLRIGAFRPTPVLPRGHIKKAMSRNHKLQRVLAAADMTTVFVGFGFIGFDIALRMM
jgi:hypothetical protein